MKKIATSLLLVFGIGTAFSQWTPTKYQNRINESKGKELQDLLVSSSTRTFFKLDLNLIREQLRNAVEMGSNAKPVVISMPTIDGKVRQYNVYSFPVVAKELADQYHLGSYIGTAVDDPTQLIRFSVAPNDLQSMLFRNGQYEFIEPVDKTNSIYGVHPKSAKSGSDAFVCSTTEDPNYKKQIDDLLKAGSSFTHNPTNFSKNSDKKYRTMRLALSATGEYTTFFGGVAGALTQMNATMTRVNGVFEKDLALHLVMQNFPGIIFSDASSDPYTGNLNTQLQGVLSSQVGDNNYDIGHVFNAAGGNGNAGCIGCVCINPTTSVPRGKGSAFTQSTNPTGDAFDIDYVAHEMGHQLGGNHTFSHGLEGAGVNVEPGSGSTIMGYAGITGPTTDVQAHSDPFFHKVSIDQIQANLISKNCDTETTITNNPPVIAPLSAHSIPKGTAFVLTASATDPENDPLTYIWEEVDNASLVINRSNLGNTKSGASFKSVAATTNPVRYFPKFESVLAGVLDNTNYTWESVSKVSRSSKFAVTVRDNNANIAEQQTSSAEQIINVGDDGPFKLANQYADVNVSTPIQWLVANTNAAPYNVANVKIDYSSDNGNTWVLLSASTANDGSENFTFPSSLNGQTIKVRVASIGNVFYAIGNMNIGPLSACSSAAPTNLVISNITVNSASASWMSYTGATYIVRYRKAGASVWTSINTQVPSVNFSGLQDATSYEVEVAMVCGTVTGAYSSTVTFSTPNIAYCAVATAYTGYEYISNVTLANVNNSSVSSGSYNNYTGNTSLYINLIKGNTYTASVSIGGADNDAVGIWIDYNKDGIFADTEKVMNYPVGTPTGPVTGTFTVPNSAIENQPLRMRVVMIYGGPNQIGLSIPSGFTCGTNAAYGEIEDYNVVISGSLGVSDVSSADNGIKIFPNPATDVLNVTKVSEKAEFTIHNAAGQLVNRGSIKSGKINVSDLVKGVYVISIKDGNKEAFTSKFIKN